ncbi:serine--tRNA ligase [Patescibacteria group bacterium]|nr:serine--tRNA ligase [Patescibacteria group bacterium]
MLDIKFIRENIKEVKDSVKKRGSKVDVDELLNLDEKIKKINQEKESLGAYKNSQNEAIKIAGSSEEKKIIITDTASQVTEMEKEMSSDLKEEKDLRKKFNELVYKIPNIVLDDVPVGGYKVLEKRGKIPKFDFKIKDHSELGESLDIIDTKRAANIAGTRFYYLKKEGALLERALINFAFDTLLKKKFIPIIPPVMISPEMAKGSGYLESASDSEAYFVKTDSKEESEQGLYLIGTSEQSLIAMHAGEILGKKDLPLRYFAFSTCFRKEAGSYGKDTKGIFRAHQFDKVEIVTFCKPEDAPKEHELILSIQKDLMDQLKLPYQVVNIHAEDLGAPAAKKYDIETWMPGQDKYRETHSTSNCINFQARRLEIKYRDENNKLQFVSTLNGTAFSMRPIIAIMENYQQKDGSIKIPQVLQKYTGFKVIKNF